MPYPAWTALHHNGSSMYPDTSNQFLRQRDTAFEAAFGCTIEVVAALEKLSS